MSTYYAMIEAKKQFLKDNPNKTEKDFDKIGVMEQDKYIDIEMKKIGFNNKKYIGSGANIYSK